MRAFTLRRQGRGACAAALVLALLAGCGGDKPEAMLASAKQYLDKHDNKAAVIQLKNALQKDPKLAEARYLLGTALLETGEPASAENELRRALDLGYPADKVVPPLARALVEQGEYKKVLLELRDKQLASSDAQADFMTYVAMAQLAEGNKGAAREALDGVFKIKSDHAQAKLVEARLKVLDKDLQGAAALVDQVLAANPGMVEALAFKANMLAYENKNDEAIKIYEKIVELRPEKVRAHFDLFSLLMRMQKMDQAAAQVEAMKKVAPKDPQTVYSHALLAYRQKNLNGARDAIQQVLKVAPQHIPSLLLAGLIEVDAQNFVQAQPYLARVVDLAPKHVVARRALAVSYLRTGQTGRAVEVIRPAVELMPDDRDVLLTAGEAYLGNNDLQQASRYFEKAAALDTHNSVARTRLGLTRLASGDTDAGLRDLEAAATMDTSHIQADAALIVAHLRRNEMDKALAAVKALEKKQPNNPVVYNLKAAVLLAKNDVPEARKSLEHALQLQPAYFPAAMNLAKLDLRDKNVDSARKRFTTILDKDPKNVDALLALAQLTMDNGGADKEVRELLERAVNANPQAVAPRVQLIGFHLRQRELKKAVASAQEAQAAIPDSPEILDLLGLSQRALGDSNQAAATFTRLAGLRPQDPLPLLRLAELQASTKDYTAARQSLRKALALKPGLPDAVRGLVALNLVQGRYDDAMTVARDAQKQSPKSPLGILLEGDVYAAQKKWPEAATAFRTGMKSFHATEFAMRLHDALGNAGKNSEADKVVSDWLKENPRDLLMRSYVAERALRNQRYEQAVQQYKTMLELQPKNAMVLNNLAWASGRLKDPKAVDYAEKALALQPDNPAVMDTLGTLLAEAGNTKRGLELLQKAVAAAPNASSIRLNYAKALAAAGQKDQARLQLDPLLKLGDGAPARQEAEALMKKL